jgi:hypothetical protein
MQLNRQCRVGFEPDIVQSPAVQAFHAYWQRLRGERELPAKSQVDIADIPRLARI